MGPVEVRPTLAQDISSVAQFLHDHMNSRLGTNAWQSLMRPRWGLEAPNHGFHMIAESRIVGVYVGVYANRIINGSERRFCNLAAFCVHPDYRPHGLRLYRAILAQPGFDFTDLSPSGNVIKLNERMGFKPLDTSTVLVPNYPSPGRRGVDVAEDLGLIRSTLIGADSTVFADHEDAPAARHLLVRSEGIHAYLMFRRDRRKRMPLFATPLFVGGSRELLRSAWPSVSAYLLTRHGLPATLAERRVLGFVPKGGWRLKTPRPRMYRSKVLEEGDVDYLYSELTQLQW